jgi:AP endonuclease-1
VKSQKKWVSKDYTEENVRKFKERMESFGYEPKYVLPHGSYLINLGNPDKWVPPFLVEIGATLTGLL